MRTCFSHCLKIHDNLCMWYKNNNKNSLTIFQKFFNIECSVIHATKDTFVFVLINILLIIISLFIKLSIWLKNMTWFENNMERKFFFHVKVSWFPLNKTRIAWFQNIGFTHYSIVAINIQFNLLLQKAKKKIFCLYTF